MLPGPLRTLVSPGDILFTIGHWLLEWRPQASDSDDESKDPDPVFASEVPDTTSSGSIRLSVVVSAFGHRSLALCTAPLVGTSL